MSTPVTPTPVDVIMDLGSVQLHFYHPGNVTFRQLCTNLAPGFAMAQTKAAKLLLVKQVQRAVAETNARFLVLSPNHSYVQVTAQAQIRSYIERILKNAATIHQHVASSSSMSNNNSAAAARAAVDPSPSATSAPAKAPKADASKSTSSKKKATPKKTSSKKKASKAKGEEAAPNFAPLVASMPSTNKNTQATNTTGGPRVVQRNRLLHGNEGVMTPSHAAAILVSDYHLAGKSTELSKLTSLPEPQQNALAQAKLEELQEEKKLTRSWAKSRIERFMLETAKSMNLQVKTFDGGVKPVATLRDIADSWAMDNSEANQTKIFYILHDAFRKYNGGDSGEASRPGTSVWGEKVEREYMIEHNMVYTEGGTTLESPSVKPRKLRVARTATNGGYVHTIVMSTVNKVQQDLKTTGARKHGVWIGPNNERKDYQAGERKRGKRAVAEGDDQVTSPTPNKKKAKTDVTPISQKKAAPKVKPAPNAAPKAKPAPNAAPKAKPAPNAAPKAKPAPNAAPKAKPAPQPSSLPLASTTRMNLGETTNSDRGKNADKVMELPVPSLSMASAPPVQEDTKLAATTPIVAAASNKENVEPPNDAKATARLKEFGQEIMASKSLFSVDGMVLIFLVCFLLILVIRYFFFASDGSDLGMDNIPDMGEDPVMSAEESYQAAVEESYQTSESIHDAHGESPDL